MILGIDHIALSCEDIIYGARLLNEVGFITKFVQNDVPNHPAKRHFLKSYAPFHSVAYCQAERGVSIELTQHSATLYDAPSSYQVLLNRLPAKTIPFVEDLPLCWGNAWCAALDCSQPAATLWSPFHAQFWYDSKYDESSQGRVCALLVPTTDLSVSEGFWINGLGFRMLKRGVTEDGCRWVYVAFHAPVQAWSLDMILAQSDQIQTLPYVDDPGFSCLAVISNRLIKDKEAMLEMGAREVSNEFNLEVGDKSLKIVMLRSPDNELVEIVEFVSTGRA